MEYDKICFELLESNVCSPIIKLILHGDCHIRLYSPVVMVISGTKYRIIVDEENMKLLYVMQW